MDNVLLLDGVSLRVGPKKIFTDLTISVERGEVVAICGSSSSTISYLTPLLCQSLEKKSALSGTVLVDGTDIQRLSSEEMRFFRMMNLAVFPDVSTLVLPDISVKKYLLLPFKEGVKKTEQAILSDAKRIMQLFGIPSPDQILGKKLSALDSVKLQAVLVASAFSTDPSLGIFHANTLGISDKETDDFYTLLIKIAKIKNMGLVLLTPDIQFARKYAEKIYIAKYDKVFPVEGAIHPYQHELEAAASLQPLSMTPKSDSVLLKAEGFIDVKKKRAMHFVLHPGEIHRVPASVSTAFFTGKKRPYKGSLSTSTAMLYKNKAYKKRVFSVSSSILFPPAKTTEEAARAYGARPTVSMSVTQITASLGLPFDYGKSPMPTCVFETLRLGLLCGAMAESKVVLLSDLDKVESTLDKYELLTLLKHICEFNGGCGVVFSDSEEIKQMLSAAPQIKMDIPENTVPEEDAVPIA